MKKVLLTFALLTALGLLAFPALSNDQCIMCHQDQADNPIPAHENCMACHADGSDAHLDNMRVHPEPVTEDTCTTCHAPNEDFMAISAHQMGMECSACHTIHED